MARRFPAIWLLFLLLLAPSSSAASAAEPSLSTAVTEQIRIGNRAMQSDNVSAALTAYRAALELDPGNDTALYNQAVALYRNGDTAQAAALFQQTAASDDTDLAAKARFNLGNTAYAQAVQLLEEDRNQATQLLQQAVRHYRESLSLDRADLDARANIELANRLLDQLQPPEQQQPQSSPPDDQQQQDDPNTASSSSPENDSPQQEESAQPQPQDEESEAQNGQDMQGRSGDEAGDDDNQQESQQGQGRPGERSGQEEQSDSPSNQGSPAGHDTPDSPESPETPSPSATESSTGTPEQGGAKEGEGDAAGEPANEEGSGDQASGGELAAAGNSKAESGPPQAGPLPLEDGATMTRQEAEKMLQAIRDRDMLRRLRRQQAERSHRLPVEKDW